MNLENVQYKIVFSADFEKIIERFHKQKPNLFNGLKAKILKVAESPILGKPLRNVLRNYRRVHIGSFVLLYEIKDKEIRFLDFDHHDRVYKKYR